MINKIYKTINNKYSKFFKFFFFLKYVFAIFLIAILLFLSIPKFFNYEKKQEILKDYLVNYYDLDLKNYDSIEFKVFPSPNLHIIDANLKVKNKPIFLNTKNLNIQETDKKKERLKPKTFPVPFPLVENQGNGTINTNTSSKPSKEE